MARALMVAAGAQAGSRRIRLGCMLLLGQRVFDGDQTSLNRAFEFGGMRGHRILLIHRKPAACRKDGFQLAWCHAILFQIGRAHV